MLPTSKHQSSPTAPGTPVIAVTARYDRRACDKAAEKLAPDDYLTLAAIEERSGTAVLILLEPDLEVEHRKTNPRPSTCLLRGR
ncbi:hypothetical protein OK016_06300 [Vibrio chagasii]|nr:hypothetical protein [Vibrio chagasii]